MKVERFVLGPLGTNCYLIENEETKELVIVDPASCPKNLRDHISEIGYTPKAIILTHGHFDHVMGVDEIRSVGRATIGVRLVKLDDGARVVGFDTVNSDADAEGEEAL